MDIEWVEMQKALIKKRSGKTRSEQLAGADVGFWASFHDMHGDKLRDLVECIMLDLRYGRRLDLTSDILMREALEALIRAISGCSVEVKKSREPKREARKIKI